MTFALPKTIALAAITATTMLAATACGSSSEAPIARKTTLNPAQAGAVLEQIALRGSEVAPNDTMLPYKDGNKVAGQVTVDDCGFHFTTEAHRIARREYSSYDKAGKTNGPSNELVAYDSPSQAALALAEWNTSARTCSTSPVHSQVKGVPDQVVTVFRNDLNLTALPVRQNAVTLESESSATTKHGGKPPAEYFVVILQSQGQYLDAVYDYYDAPVTSAQLNDDLHLASITGQRLSQLA